ncbi:hypothetical protein FBEOM_5968 [Fusarium beomiforme]|uniref:Uncharacterized protein n=1 Tax=Fusarium beomiforme TaxID=44412 RepID=A0A9P5DZG5_9HYPO|nr:hypothetical protein FBEOM_5968 [Fusarium beomiforme]
MGKQKQQPGWQGPTMQDTIQRFIDAFNDVKKDMSPDLANDLAPFRQKHLKSTTPTAVTDICRCPIFEALESSISFPEWFFLALSSQQKEAHFYGNSKKGKVSDPHRALDIAEGLEAQTTPTRRPYVPSPLQHTLHGDSQNNDQTRVSTEAFADLLLQRTDKSIELFNELDTKFNVMQERFSTMEIFKATQEAAKVQQDSEITDLKKLVKEQSAMMKDLKKENKTLHEAVAKIRENGDEDAKSFDTMIDQFRSQSDTLKEEIAVLRPPLIEIQQKTITLRMDKIEKKPENQQKEIVDQSPRCQVQGLGGHEKASQNSNERRWA